MSLPSLPTCAKSDAIHILGTGVFGLSSALHLASHGYRNITLFDRHDHGSTDYDSLASPLQNDGASCDLNKILRTSYGSDELIHNWACRSRDEWVNWNEQLRRDNGDDAVPLFEQCGYLRLDDALTHRNHERGSLATFAAGGLRDTQYDISLPEDITRAKKDGWAHKLDPCERRDRGLHTIGVLDTTAGFVYASRACTFVLRRLRSLGVKTVLGGPSGTFSQWLPEQNGHVRFQTADGQEHKGARIIVALGPWSTSALPELRPNVQASAGNIALVQISSSRDDLRQKYSSKNMPIVHWKAGKDIEKEPGGGVYAFPAAPDCGIVKIGVRGTKWLNPVQGTDGQTISIPRTAATSPSETRMPIRSLEAITTFLQNNMPDLRIGARGVSSTEGDPPAKLIATRLCFYTDTFDNQFYICPSPRDPRIVLCTGGSGHGFKFLPVLGEVTRDVVEGRETELTRRFAWREAEQRLSQGVGELELQLDQQELCGPENSNSGS